MKKYLFRIETMILLLIALTAISIAWHHLGMNNTYVIEPSSPITMKADSDRSNGGYSSATLEYSLEAITLNCEIVLRVAYPYCQMHFGIGTDEEGVNLEKYDELDLYLKQEGGIADRLRIRLKNYNPIYSTPRVPSSLKHNEIEFHPNNYNYPINFKKSDFRVATWWISEYHIKVAHSRRELSNVTSVDILTGSTPRSGNLKIDVEKLVWRGKWVTKLQLYEMLLGLWITAFLILLFARFFVISKQLTDKNAREQELLAVNHLLNIKSQKIEDQAKRDPLTGALNRAGLRDILHAHTYKVQHNISPLSIIFFDVDYFKDINDQLGHAAGDKALTNIVSLVSKATSEDHDLIRWGGEEFLIICPEQTLNQGLELAETLRREIENSSIINEKNITCSFGVAQMRRDEDIADYLKRADQALYRAKAQGRNNVVAAN